MSAYDLPSVRSSVGFLQLGTIRLPILTILISDSKDSAVTRD